MEATGSRQVYASPWMTVREDQVRRADGSSGVYGVVEMPDIALVIPVDGDRLHLVEQYRHPIAARSWEFPSGTTDPRLDADASLLAARELREETGLTAASLTRLGELDVMPSTLAQRCTVFLATGLTPGTPRREVAEQDMRSAWFARDEVERLIHHGGITDAKSVAAFALYLLHDRSSGG